MTKLEILTISVGRGKRKWFGEQRSVGLFRRLDIKHNYIYFFGYS